jgi:hypothetical protein
MAHAVLDGGHIGTEEGIVEIIADARSRHLKPGARVIPASLRIFTTPAHVPRFARQVSRNLRIEGIDIYPVTRALADYTVTFPAREMKKSQFMFAPRKSWEVDFTGNLAHSDRV